MFTAFENNGIAGDFRKSPRPSHGQDMISHPMPFLTCLLRSFLKSSAVDKTASFPQNLLQCLTPLIIVNLFPKPNPSLRCCTSNPFILNLWLAYQTQALNTSPTEIQKGILPEWKKSQFGSNVVKTSSRWPVSFWYSNRTTKTSMDLHMGQISPMWNQLRGEDQTMGIWLRAVSWSEVQKNV